MFLRLRQSFWYPTSLYSDNIQHFRACGDTTMHTACKPQLRVEPQPQQSNTEEAAPDSLLRVSKGPWSCFILDVKNICINYSFLRFLIFEIFANMKTWLKSNIPRVTWEGVKIILSKLSHWPRMNFTYSLYIYALPMSRNGICYWNSVGVSLVFYPSKFHLKK